MKREWKMDTHKYTDTHRDGWMEREWERKLWARVNFFPSNPFGFALCLMVNNKIGDAKSSDVVKNMLKYWYREFVTLYLRYVSRRMMNVKMWSKSKYMVISHNRFGKLNFILHRFFTTVLFATQSTLFLPKKKNQNSFQCIYCFSREGIRPILQLDMTLLLVS